LSGERVGKQGRGKGGKGPVDWGDTKRGRRGEDREGGRGSSVCGAIGGAWACILFMDTP